MDDSPEGVPQADSDQMSGSDEAVRIQMNRVSKPWQDMWRTILRQYAEVEASYAGRDNVPASRSSEHWRDQVFSFFVACDSLMDYIKKTVPSAASKAWPYVRDTWSLSLCRAIANTYKHHTPYVGQATADITSTSVTLVGPSIAATGRACMSYDIAYTDKDGTSGTIDALDLARRSLDDWRKFFSQYGLNAE